MNNEQQNEALKQTLKNGLFNGLKCEYVSPTVDRKIVGILSSLSNSDTYECATMISMDIIDGVIHFEDLTPFLFPLSHLNKEITVEGYNDNKSFVPVLLLFDKFVKMGCMSHEDHNDQVDGILFMIEQHIDEVPARWVIELNKMKFNTEGLPPESFIDASKSKVYEPKK